MPKHRQPLVISARSPIDKLNMFVNGTGMSRQLFSERRTWQPNCMPDWQSVRLTKSHDTESCWSADPQICSLWCGGLEDPRINGHHSFPKAQINTDKLLAECAEYRSLVCRRRLIQPAACNLGVSSRGLATT